MIILKLSELTQGLQIKQIYNEKDHIVTGVHYNSLKIQKDNVFVAIKGYSTDGHKYIPSAVQNGACAVVCQEYCPEVDCTQIIVEDSRIAEAIISANFFKNPAKNFKLVGITGTNGKTTCTYLIKKILEYSGYKVGLIGTNQNMIGDKVFETGRTTPDSFELWQLFGQMADENVDYVVMEVSSHALELNRVYGCEFEVGAFTNLTQDHLDFHVTMENYANAKQKIFGISKNAVINIDDKYGFEMSKKSNCNVIGYGIHGGNLNAKNVKFTSKGVAFDIEDTCFELDIPGEFSVYNGLCAIGVCKALGIDDKKIKSGLKSSRGVKGRAEVVDTNTDYTVMIDYAHTPDGIENILTTVKGFAKGRVIIVFGCGGDRDNTKRPIMGEIAGKIADFCVVTSDNPRSENPVDIINMIIPGVQKTGTPYEVICDRKEAIRYALSIAKKGDVVVLAGKGHETYQILNEGTIDFDERKIVSEILKG